MTNNEAGVSAVSSANNKKSSASQLEMKDKLRVLCLHGYRQNGETFKNKLGLFPRHVKKYAELVFLDAPHIANPLVEGGESQPDQLSWWFNKHDGTFSGANRNGPAYGFQESLKFVEDNWKAKGPFHGLLGFSQGACFVGLICGLAKKKLTSIRPDFAIISSGFLSGSLVHKTAYEEPITIPTLHIFGICDDIIPNYMSLDLARIFKNVEVLDHDGGHCFPGTPRQRLAYITFFQDRVQEYLENLELHQPSNMKYDEGEDEEEEEEGEEEEEDESDMQTSSDSENSAA